MAVSVRHLQNDASQILAFALVKVHILAQFLDLLLKFRDDSGRLLLFLLAPLPKARTSPGIPSAFLVRYPRCSLDIDRQVDSSRRRFQRHHLIHVLAS